MGREIKFRAWDGERLRNVNTIGWTNGELDWLDTPKYHGPIDEDIKIMQHTGRKDIKDIDIYEGDILTSKEYPYQDEGKYSYHGIVEYDEEFAAFLVVKRVVNPLKRGISNGIAEYFEEGPEFEVIGNIYENPELLQKEETK